MESMLLYDHSFPDFEYKYLNTKELDDLDSGFSSNPSSPGDLCSSPGFIGNDFKDMNFPVKSDFQSKDDKLIMNVKTELIEDDLCSGFLPPTNDELLSMFMDGFELTTKESNIEDNFNDTTCTASKENTSIPCTVSQSRKRTLSDHTYAHEDLPSDNEDKNDATQDESYLEKRRRNNLAAKKSRQLKRNKEIENLKKYDKLSKENKNLQKELKKLQSLVNRLETKLK